MKHILSVIILLLSLSGHAQMVTNGSVTGSPTGINNADNASGWMNCGWSPDLCDVNFPAYSGNSTVSVVASPDGGTWLGLANTGAVEECASTTITGLTPGNQYTLYFYGACFGTGTSIANSSPAIITATLGAETQNYSIPMVASTWSTYSLNFTATSSAMTLRMETFTGDGYAGLDGFRLDDCTTQVDIGDDTTLCLGQTLLLDASGSNTTYLWQDNSTGPTFTVTQPGSYWVEITDSCGSASDTITVDYISLQTIDLGNDTSLCQGESLLLDASLPNAAYLWQNNSTTPTLTVGQPGTYWVEVSYSCGVASDTILVTYRSALSVELGNDTLLCEGQTLLLDATNVNATYLWQDNSTGSTFSVTQAGTYSVQVTDDCGTVSGQVTVTYTTSGLLNLGSDTVLCQGQDLLLAPDVVNSDYVWQDNSTGADFMVTQPGTYWVSVSNSCGTISDTITVEFNSAPSFNLGNDVSLCQGQNLLLDASDPNAFNVEYTWQDNSTAPTFLVTEAGTYTVRAINECGIATDDIVVTYNSLSIAALGEDTSLCAGQMLVLNAASTNSTYLWQDNSTGPSITVTAEGSYWVEITNDCGITSDTINVNYSTAPQFDLGSDSVICEDSVLILNASFPDASYAWQDNSQDATFIVTSAGTYWVNATNSCGSMSDTINVSSEECDCRVFPPTAFSPNGDFFNDRFAPLFNCDLEFYKLRIYNRWGELLFETEDIIQSWDGTFKSEQMPMDTYIFQLNYRFKDNVDSFDTGIITLVR